MRSRFKLAAVTAATLAMITAGAGAASAGTTPSAKPPATRPPASATPGARLVIHPLTAAHRAVNSGIFTGLVTSGVNVEMCLDVYHSGTANYTNVDIYQCNNTAAQRWTFVPVYYSGNVVYAYKIMSNVASLMCLDDYHSQINNYNNVDIYQCNGTNAQIWYVYNQSLETAADPSFGTCLDVYHGGTANYTNVDVFQCNGTAAQTWYY